jgi:hypothetical protein
MGSFLEMNSLWFPADFSELLKATGCQLDALLDFCDLDGPALVDDKRNSIMDHLGITL